MKTYLAIAATYLMSAGFSTAESLDEQLNSLHNQFQEAISRGQQSQPQQPPLKRPDWAQPLLDPTVAEQQKKQRRATLESMKEIDEQVEKSKMRFRFTVVQMLEDGALVRFSISNSGAPMFIYGLRNSMLSGNASWEGDVYAAGQYYYTNALGVRRSVPALATSTFLAKRHLIDTLMESSR